MEYLMTNFPFDMLFLSPALPFLRSTVVLLYPVLLVVIGYIVSLAVGWNIGQTFLHFYEYRVVTQTAGLSQTIS